MSPRRGRTAPEAGVVLFGLVAALSLLPRLVALDVPLLDRYAFRQTQTALVARTLERTGLDLLDHQLPIFGPPWQVPFELPLFQAGVALVYRSGVAGSDFDLACRITGLVAFYLSAAMLYLVARRVAPRNASLTIVGFYLLSPFDVVWSRACLIDFTSVALALSYLYCILGWAGSRRSWRWATATVVMGSLAAVAKITTVAMIVPAAIAAVVVGLARAWRGDGSSEPRTGDLWWRLAQAVAMAAIPLVIAQSWIAHGDAIKVTSPLTEWLTSARLHGWNWGTLAQRFDFSRWSTIAGRIWTAMLPGLLIVLPVLAVLGRRERRRRVFLAALAGAGALLPIGLFFNLYVVHEYYLIAIAPAVAFLAGLGLHAALETLRRPALRVLLLALCAWPLLASYARLLGDFRAEARRERPVLTVARSIREIVPPGEPYALAQPGMSWNPTLPYYSDRPTVILTPHPRRREVNRVLRRTGVRFAVLHLNHADPLPGWSRRTLRTVEDYEIAAIRFHGGRTRNPPSPRQRLAALDARALDLAGPELDPASFARVRDVALYGSPEGLVVEASGGRPALLLPPLGDPSGHRLLVRLVLDAPSRTLLKLYYTTRWTSHYNEELKVRSPLVAGRNDVLLEIAHPQLEGRLRLDPGEVAGTYRLRELEVALEAVPPRAPGDAGAASARVDAGPATSG